MSDGIINEILDWQRDQIIAGNIPDSIPLTEEQKTRLKIWCDETSSLVYSSDGRKEAIDGVPYSGRMIFGMKF